MAAIDEVSICNIALQELGAAKITALDEGTTEANLCTLYFPFARNAVLEMHRWNFAYKRTAAIAQLGSTPNWKWDYAYLVPTDALRVFDINDETADWAIEINSDGKKAIVTNCSTLKCGYVFEQTDTQKFSFQFVLALAKYLKMQLAIPLTGKRTRFGDAVEEFRTQLQIAKTADGQEGRAPLLENYALEEVR